MKASTTRKGSNAACLDKDCPCTGRHLHVFEVVTPGDVLHAEDYAGGDGELYDLRFISCEPDALDAIDGVTAPMLAARVLRDEGCEEPSSQPCVPSKGTWFTGYRDDYRTGDQTETSVHFWGPWSRGELENAYAQWKEV